MRIVGGKDYYDHGLAYGVDQSVVFVRTGGLVRKKQWHDAGLLIPTGGAPAVKSAARHGAEFDGDNWRSKYTRWKHGRAIYEMESVHVVLCGRYYSGARVHSAPLSQYGNPVTTTSLGWTGKESEHKSGNWRHRGWASETFWDANSLGRYLSKCGMNLEMSRRAEDNLFAARRRAESSARYKPFARYALERQELDYIIQQRVTVATLTCDDHDYFEDPHYNHRVDDFQWRVNDDTLKDLDFVKVMDPVRAFQEISMWVGGVLPRPGPEMVEISDPKVKLAKHGMDETSFRKPPQKVR